MKSTELASMLRPFWQRDIAGSNVVSPNSADYVFHVDGATCFAFDGLTGAVVAAGSDHAAIIQAVIDLAGAGGVLAFRGDTFLLSTYVQPLGGQTWHVLGATFQPTVNTTVLRIYENDHFKLLGSLSIIDASSVLTSQTAVYIYSMRYAHIDHLFIKNCYRGIDLVGNTSGAGTNENTFVDLYIEARSRGLNLEGSCHDNHFIHTWVCGTNPASWGAESGIRIATGGTQGGNVFNQVEVLHMHTGLDLPGAYEVWFGNVILDNIYGVGIYMSGIVEFLAFNTLWISSVGTGVQMGGIDFDLPTTRTDKIHIGQMYSWLVADYALRVVGYTEQVIIGNLTVERARGALAFEGLDNHNWVINSFYARDNDEFDLDASGATDNIFIRNALIEKPVINPENLAEISGARTGVGKFDNFGKSVMLSGATTVVVSHGLEGAPLYVHLTPYDAEVSAAYVTAVGSSTFTITVATATTANRSIAWQAHSRGPYGENLLLNPSVEDGAGPPSNWNQGANTEWVNALPENGPAVGVHSGAYSLRILVSGATGEFISAQFGVIGSRDYVLGAFVRGQGSAQTFLTIRWWNGGSFLGENNISLDQNYTGWKLVFAFLTAPASALTADVAFRCPSSTVADIYGDDFFVREVL